MRLGIWCTSYFEEFGGAEKIVNDLVNRFTEIGIETFLIANRKRKGESNNPYLERLHPNVKIYQNTFRNPLDFIHQPGLFIIRLFQFLKAAVQLGFFLRRSKLEIVHLHFVSLDILLLVLFQYFFGYKIVVTFVGLEAETAKTSKLAHLKLRLALKYADCATAVSEDLCHQLRTSFSRREILYVPNGIDVDKIRRSALLSLPDIKEDQFVFCGRLTAVKRVPFLIDAFVDAINRGLKQNLYIVGDGEEAGEIKEIICSYGIQDRVITLGALHHSEALSIINRSKCLLLSSSSEGCPMVVLESMALGKPVIVPDLPGLKEIVTHGETGYLYPADRKDLLSELLLEMALSTCAGSKGTAILPMKFGFNSMIQNYLQIYEKWQKL